MAIRELLDDAPTIPPNDLLFNGGTSLLPIYDSNQTDSLLTPTSEGTAIPADNPSHPSSMDSRQYLDYLHQQYLGHGSLARIPERVTQQSGPIVSPSDSVSSLPSEIFTSLEWIDDDAMASGGFASVHVGISNGSKVTYCASFYIS